MVPVNPTMLQERDATLAADLMRFGGANQKELWLGYAKSGMGQAATTGNNTSLNETDTDPVPAFDSPLHDNATITFAAKAKDGGAVPARIFVGHYEGRVSPIADTNPATPAAGTPVSVTNLDDTAKFVPGTYEFVATAPGYGHLRFRKTFHRREGHESDSRGPVRPGRGAAGVRRRRQRSPLRRLTQERPGAREGPATAGPSPFLLTSLDRHLKIRARLRRPGAAGVCASKSGRGENATHASQACCPCGRRRCPRSPGFCVRRGQRRQ
jgi:hypothetical protein